MGKRFGSRRSRESASSTRRPTAKDIDRQLRQWSVRRVVSWSALILAVVIAVQHLLAHAGYRPVPLSMPAQDLLIGYPTAAIVAIVGALLIDPRPRL